MSTHNDINNEYFEWLYRKMCDKKFARGISYRKLFMILHDTEFVYSLPMDENRASDGLDLRYRFSVEKRDGSLERYIRGPCSLLEMMVALSIRCEESIMDNTQYGDRTKQWFWEMVTNLGLGHMSDDMFNKDEARYKINRFLDREYSPDGRGGLFTIKDCKRDLRDVEIWYQLCWYLNTFNG